MGMDSSMNTVNCDGAGASLNPDHITISAHGLKPDELKQNKVNDVTLILLNPDEDTQDLNRQATNNILDTSHNKADHTETVLEQQLIGKTIGEGSETLINKDIIDDNSNKCDVHGKDFEVETSYKSPNVEVKKITEESSNMMIDEQHLQTESNVDPALTVIKVEKNIDSNRSSSLALLAQYDTENDSDDDVREIPVQQTYQSRCVNIDSDSSTSDVEFLNETRSEINLDRLDVDNEEDDDEEEGGNIRSTRQPKVKGELHLEDLPPIEDLHITVPEEECTELGKIHSVVEQLVLVNALPSTVPLDLDTVLFRDKGKQVLGEVFDVLGQISEPLYCVRFNSNKEIKEKGIEVGQVVYVAPRTKHTQFVVLANLMKVRGSDASWENDVEPPPRFIDYSDDEEERSAKRPNRKRQSSVGATYPGTSSYTPRRPYRGNFSGRDGGRQPIQQSQGNNYIAGSSWHSNFYQPQMLAQQQYRQMGQSPRGYTTQSHNNSFYQQPPPVNPGLVINPYAIYPPPQARQQHFLQPPHQQPPPPQ